MLSGIRHTTLRSRSIRGLARASLTSYSLHRSINTTQQPKATMMSHAQVKSPLNETKHSIKSTVDDFATEPTPKETFMDDSFIGLTGGEIVREMLLRHNVDTAFGYSGGAILPVFDAVSETDKINFIMPRHEQGGGHMAEGYARVLGKPGIVVVTSGPGATNIVTPLADALMDGVPLVVFTGQVPTTAIGTDAFQEADIIGITRSCTKWNVMVKLVEELPRRINEAFEIATSGRPGPVLVDLPKDVTGTILREAIPVSATIPHNQVTQITKRAINEYTHEAISRSADLLKIAKKPIIYCGAGILNHKDGPEILKKLSDVAQIPVTTTIQALGAFDQRDPKSMGMLGMHGNAAANSAMQEADLIIAIGGRFDDRVTGLVSKFAPVAKQAGKEGRGGIVQFEISPKNINKVVQVNEAIVGDATKNLKEFLKCVTPVSERPEWMGQCQKWKEMYPYKYLKELPGSRVKPQSLIREISKQAHASKRDTIITTGVGQHQMWTAQHYLWTQPRTMITSGGLGTMGFGLPAAIGAQIANPEAMVIDIDGDASFAMTMMEFITAAQYNIPVKVCVLNNQEQGMVTQWQSMFYGNRYMHTYQHNPDFAKFAESLGVQSVKITEPEEMVAGVTEFINAKGPVLLEVVVESKVPVLPMVLGGNALNDFMVWDEATGVKEDELRAKLREAKQLPRT